MKLLKKLFWPGFDNRIKKTTSAGDEPLESAVRELAEKLGIQVEPDDLKFHGTLPI